MLSRLSRQFCVGLAASFRTSILTAPTVLSHNWHQCLCTPWPGPKRTNLHSRCLHDFRTHVLKHVTHNDMHFLHFLTTRRHIKTNVSSLSSQWLRCCLSTVICGCSFGCLIGCPAGCLLWLSSAGSFWPRSSGPNGSSRLPMTAAAFSPRLWHTMVRADPWVMWNKNCL